MSDNAPFDNIKLLVNFLNSKVIAFCNRLLHGGELDLAYIYCTSLLKTQH